MTACLTNTFGSNARRRPCPSIEPWRARRKQSLHFLRAMDREKKSPHFRIKDTTSRACMTIIFALVNAASEPRDNITCLPNTPGSIALQHAQAHRADHCQHDSSPGAPLAGTQHTHTSPHRPPTQRSPTIGHNTLPKTPRPRRPRTPSMSVPVHTCMVNPGT